MLYPGRNAALRQILRIFVVYGKERVHTGAGRPGQQPQKHGCSHPQGGICGGDRAQRVRKKFLGLRHYLRRGPAPLHGHPVHLCQALHGHPGKAGGRGNYRPEPHHCHRTENHRQQSPFHGGHHHGNLRLPAPAVCQRLPGLFPGKRPGDGPLHGRPDRGPHHEPVQRSQMLPSRAAYPGPKRSLSGTLRPNAQTRLHGSAHRRRNP